MATKRTKKSYERLFENPTSLFPNVETIIYPNGRNEIWFRPAKANGLGFAIEVGLGPRGLGLRIRTFAGCEPITITSTSNTHLELCQYLPDADSQTYKEAYLAGNPTFTRVVKELEAKKQGNQYDCMRCEETFESETHEEFCPKCRGNMNRTNIGGAR